MHKKPPMHKVFISYHHANDQGYKDEPVAMATRHELFIDHSVATGDVPDRIVDNLVAHQALVSVTGWGGIENDPNPLRTLIELTCQDRTKCQYDLSRRMRRRNS